MDDPKKTQGLVSVVVTCCNKAPYVYDCLKSIGQQTYRPIEVVFVDDASVAGESYETARAVARFAAEYPDIMVFPMWLVRRSGTAWAQNVGYYQACGEYIMNLDGDDVIHPEKVARQLAYMKEYDLDVCGTNYNEFTDVIDPAAENKAHVWLRSGVEAIREDYRRNIHRLCWGSCMMKASVIDQVGGNNKRCLGAEDYEICKRIVDAGFKVDNLMEVLYYYRINPTQRSKLYHTKK